MDHRKITQLRDRARVARAHGEKTLATPDEMDALLDLALAQIEDDWEAAFRSSNEERNRHRDDSVRFRLARDEANSRAGKAEKERDDARYGMEVATQQRNNWESIARQAIAEQHPRPLTPDDITDEMVEQAREAWRASSEIGAELWRVVLRAALAGPPARPEGAEELDCLLDEAHKQGRDVSEEADFLASKGVRVVGSGS